MALSPFAKNEMLDHLATLAGFASLHSADPGTTGASELTGGSPAYGRIAVTWDPASGGLLAMDTGAPPEFDVFSTTVRFGGLWTASTGGSFIGGGATSNVTYAGQGTYELETVEVALP